MSNYQRLISYIYTYESGLKGKNVGFAKLETRNSQCRLTVNVKKVVPVGSPLGVYLLSGDGEQRIGTLFSRNGTGEFRALLNADRVEGSGRPLQEFFGLSIHEAENAGHSYTTIWEDAAMNAAEAVKKEEKNADRSQEKLQSRQEEERADQAEEIGPESEAEEALEKQEKEAGRPEKEEQKPEAEKPEEEEEEIKPVEEKVEREEEKREAEEEKTAAKEEKTTAEEVQSRAEQEKEEEETKRETEEKNKRAKGEEPEEETKRVNVEAAQTAPERAGKTDEAGEQEKNSIRERLLCQNTLPPIRTVSSHALSGTGAGTEAMTEGKTDAMTEARTEARTDRRSARPRSRRRPDGGMSAREWAENLAAPRGLNRDCKTEATIKADDRAFIPLHELDDGCSHQRMWARLRRKYPKILAFDYEPGCEILTIKPQDIGLLPREAWIFGNNSFLLHGYYSYRYLILARLENPGGEPRYLLGVPGHYSSNEKYMASMFGFSDFIMSKKQPSGDDCFGYWYTDVRVGN